MRRESLSIAVACLLGALIGTLAALEIAVRFSYGSYFWGIGALLGGVVAYVAVDFRHFSVGVANSYRRTIAWCPNKYFWKTALIFYGGIVVCYSSIVWSIGVPICFLDETETASLLVVLWFSISMSCGGLLLSYALLVLNMSLSGNIGHSGDNQGFELLRKAGWTMILRCNPFWVLYAITVGLWWLVVRIPSTVVRGVPALLRGTARCARCLAQFIIGVFIFVHSGRRTLCFADATIGAAIGYSFGSVIIGTIAGAVLGVINYELVSVRLLKLAPVRNPTA